ncbi:MAG: DNA repair protein RadC [Bacteroidota bacterium]
MKLNIKSWAEEDRPREKLLLKGKHNLSDAELLAILIGSGNREESAVSLIQQVLKNYDHNLASLAKASVTELKQFKGIGEAKAITIIAALEIGNRKIQSQVKDKIQISNSRDAYQFLAQYMAELVHEEFWVLYLNRANKVISKELLSSGGISGTVVDIRILLKRCVELLSSSIVLLHNHPSGNLHPSEEDKKLTKKIREACLHLDIQVIDHIIITYKGYFSFADEGLL